MAIYDVTIAWREGCPMYPTPTHSLQYTISADSAKQAGRKIFEDVLPRLGDGASHVHVARVEQAKK